MKTANKIIIFLLLITISCNRNNADNQEVVFSNTIIEIIEKNIVDLAGFISQPENSPYYNDLDVEKVSEKTAYMIEKIVNIKNINSLPFGERAGGRGQNRLRDKPAMTKKAVISTERRNRVSK